MLVVGVAAAPSDTAAAYLFAFVVVVAGGRCATAKDLSPIETLALTEVNDAFVDASRPVCVCAAK